MKMTFDSPLTANSILLALSVLGKTDKQGLNAVFANGEIETTLEAVREHPAVKEDDGVFSIDKEAAAEILATAERTTVPLYRSVLESAVDYLTRRLQMGDAHLQDNYIQAHERLATRLVADDPRRLMHYVRTAEALNLNNEAHRQKVAYFKGVALAKAERYDEALIIYNDLLEQPNLDGRLEGQTLNARSIAYRLTGRLGEALAGYRQSLRVWRDLDDQRYEGIVLTNMGIISYELQSYEEAERHLKAAEAALENFQPNPWLAGVYNELGLVYRDRGMWRESLAYFEKFFAKRRDEDADDHVGAVLNNVGELYLFQGKIDEAVAHLQEGLEKMETRAYQIDSYLHLGLAYQARGEFKEAAEAYQQALTLGMQIGRREILPHVYYRLGDLALREGDQQQALEHLEKAVELIEETREPLKEEHIKISLLGRWQQVYEALILLCVDLGRSQEAFAWAERARARAFAEGLPSGSGAAPIVSVAQLQEKLGTDQIMISYFTTGVLEHDIPLLRAIAKENPLREILLIKGDLIIFQITKETFTAERKYFNPNVLVTNVQMGYDPRRFLAQNIQRHIAPIILPDLGGAKRLTVIPHGPLHQIPFVALLTEQPDVVLSYAPSGTIWHHLQERPMEPVRHLAHLIGGRQKECLAIAYHGETQSGSDRQLKYVADEASAVAQLMDGDAWVGGLMSKANLQFQASGTRWLHFACHGWFNHDKPLSSALEVGRGEKLTAAEILRHWSLQAQLVTLSACQTGVSRVLRSDEPLGLVRAFLYAGARSVLVTQWPVEDLPTYLLMLHFYWSLQAQRESEIDRALAQAQQWLRNVSRNEAAALLNDLGTAFDELPVGERPFADPRYWAAFVLVG